jgi:hypothetical protein
VNILISEHARFQMSRRNISEEIATEVTKNPQQVVKLAHERRIHQSKYYESAQGKEMLLRLICTERRDVPFVVTVYKTSKIDKYWAKEA